VLEVGLPVLLVPEVLLEVVLPVLLVLAVLLETLLEALLLELSPGALRL